MPSNFSPMGGVPDFYRQLMQQAQNGLVRMPDGSYAQAPQYGAGGNVSQFYNGILPSPPPSVPQPLASRSVHSIQINPDGSPVLPRVPYGGPPDSQAQTVAQQQQARRSIPAPPPSGSIRTAGQAGNVALPQGVVPMSVLRAFDQMGLSNPMSGFGPQGGSAIRVPSANGTYVADKGQDRLSTQQLSYAGDEGTPPPLAAINSFAGVPLPRVRPTPPGAMPPRAPWTPGIPLEDAIDPRLKQNDIAANIATALGNSPAGNIGSLLTGGIPQSGLLNMLFPIGLAGVRAPATATAAPRVVAQGPGPNGSAGQGTIYNNPTKYGATKQDRQASAARRAALSAFGGN